jgi:hypothetical protein
MYPINTSTKIKTDVSIDFLFSFLNIAISSSKRKHNSIIIIKWKLWLRKFLWDRRLLSWFNFQGCARSCPLKIHCTIRPLKNFPLYGTSVNTTIEMIIILLRERERETATMAQTNFSRSWATVGQQRATTHHRLAQSQAWVTLAKFWNLAGAARRCGPCVIS